MGKTEINLIKAVENNWNGDYIEKMWELMTALNTHEVTSPEITVLRMQRDRILGLRSQLRSMAKGYERKIARLQRQLDKANGVEPKVRLTVHNRRIRTAGVAGA